MNRCHRTLPLAAWALAATLAAAAPLAAQPVLEIEETLDFDDPEAWAMKYFTTLALATDMGAVEPRTAGEIELGFELLQVPHLDREQRTVGFNGFKEEDLNRTPVWGRLRITAGLGGGFWLTAGWVPPVEVDGVEANLVSLELGRTLLARGPWSLSGRLHALSGEVDGDFTCAAGGDERFPPGSSENPFGCQEPSRDTQSMDAWGAGLTLGFSPPRGPALHLGVGWSALDMEFQVDALTFGFRDRTLLLADGDVTTFTGGVTWRLGSRSRLAFEALYAPLEVERRGDPGPGSDDLLHLRALWRLRLR